MPVTHFERATSPDAYAQALAHAYFAGYRIYDPSIAAARDPEAENKMLRFPPFVAPLQVRHTTIAGRRWTISPPDEGGEKEKELAKITARIISNLDGFTLARLNLVRADVSGARYAERVTRVITATYGDGKPRKWVVPVQLADMAKENFRWRPTPGQATPRARLEYARKSTGTVRWVPVPSWAPLVRHVIGDSEEMLGYGRGMRDALWFLFGVLTRTFESDAKASERLGHGWLVLQLDHEATGDITVTNKELVDKAHKALEKMKARNSFIIGKGDTLTMLGPPSGATEFMGKLAERLERMADRVIMGATLFAGGGSAGEGSMARAETEADTATGVFDTLSDILEETLTRDLVAPCVRDNHANFVELGLADAEHSKLDIERGRKTNPKDVADRAEVVLRSGAKIKAQEYYDGVGFTRPGPDDEVIEAPEQMVGGGAPAIPFAAEWDEARHKRDSGRFATHEGAGAEDDPTPQKKAPPGSQLPDETRARLKDLGVTKLPDVESTDVDVHDLGAEDVDTHAVMTWKDRGGKTQHAYTAAFHEANAAKKWERTQAIAPRLDEIRSGLLDAVGTGAVGSHEHEGATIAAIIAHSGLRPGSSGSAAQGHFGVSTLHGSHVTIEGGVATLNYVGKSGKDNVGQVTEPALVEALAAYKERAGDGPLFSGAALGAARDAAGDVKLKDFRTVIAGRVASRSLAGMGDPPPPMPSKGGAKLVRGILKAASEKVATRLNNTPAVARASYIHPAVFAEWGDAHGVPAELCHA